MTATVFDVSQLSPLALRILRLPLAIPDDLRVPCNLAYYLGHRAARHAAIARVMAERQS